MQAIEVCNLTAWKSDARVYAITAEKPTHYVIASATTVEAWNSQKPEPETYVFACDDAIGSNPNFSELPGSFKGALDHNRAINGYLDSLIEEKGE